MVEMGCTYTSGVDAVVSFLEFVSDRMRPDNKRWKTHHYKRLKKTTQNYETHHRLKRNCNRCGDVMMSELQSVCLSDFAHVEGKFLINSARPRDFIPCLCSDGGRLSRRLFQHGSRLHLFNPYLSLQNETRRFFFQTRHACDFVLKRP